MTRKTRRMRRRRRARGVAWCQCLMTDGMLCTAWHQPFFNTRIQHTVFNTPPTCVQDYQGNADPQLRCLCVQQAEKVWATLFIQETQFLELGLMLSKSVPRVLYTALRIELLSCSV